MPQRPSRFFTCHFLTLRIRESHYAISCDCWFDCSTDVEAAAELGRTLLERNRELESTVRQQQAVIDDQTQEMEVKKYNITHITRKKKLSFYHYRCALSRFPRASASLFRLFLPGGRHFSFWNYLVKKKKVTKFFSKFTTARQTKFLLKKKVFPARNKFVTSRVRIYLNK